jgi:DNA-binding LacI/PurR family transcriptional regulator
MIACPYEEDPVNAALGKLLALSPQPTALVFQTDDLAVPVLLRLGRYNKRVPQDYSVVGFDDSTYAADAGLTTMRQDPADLGRQAAQMTLGLIRDAGHDAHDAAAHSGEQARDAAQQAMAGQPEGRAAESGLSESDLFVSPTARLILRSSTAPISA